MTSRLAVINILPSQKFAYNTTRPTWQFIDSSRVIGSYKQQASVWRYITLHHKNVDDTRHSTSHRSQSQIFVENHYFFAPVMRVPVRLCHNICLIKAKPEWCSYPTVKKVWGYDYSFWYNTWMWQTDTWHTECQHRPWLCIASCEVNHKYYIISF